MADQRSLRQPTMDSTTQNSQRDFTMRTGRDSDDNLHLDDTTMDSTSPKSDNQTTGDPRPTTPELSKSAPKTPDTDNRLDVIRHALETQGVSEKTINLISKEERATTGKHYISAWKNSHHGANRTIWIRESTTCPRDIENVADTPPRNSAYGGPSNSQDDNQRGQEKYRHDQGENNSIRTSRGVQFTTTDDGTSTTMQITTIMPKEGMENPIRLQALLKDAELCPVTALHLYISRTRERSPGYDKFPTFFITARKVPTLATEIWWQMDHRYAFRKWYPSNSPLNH
ncbi:uncharacterized protein VTP21DRAFT_9628 [Calcarisporiella thermophila]|uniref:uncharacterized protein n=1 Tax=Calcarisporiella thermophila TaxID=911321 RepID=UPI0037427F02